MTHQARLGDLSESLSALNGMNWSLAVPEQSVCQGVKGVLEVVNKTTGKIAVFNAGDCWSMVPGHEGTLSNPGAADREHLFYTLFGKKQWDRKEVAALRSVAVRPSERAPIGASAPMGRIRQHNFRRIFSDSSAREKRQAIKQHSSGFGRP